MEAGSSGVRTSKAWQDRACAVPPDRRPYRAFRHGLYRIRSDQPGRLRRTQRLRCRADVVRPARREATAAHQRSKLAPLLELAMKLDMIVPTARAPRRDAGKHFAR